MRRLPDKFNFDKAKEFEFIIENSIIAESCNLLTTPSCLRLELLPDDILEKIINKIDNIIKKYDIKKDNEIAKYFS